MMDVGMSPEMERLFENIGQEAIRKAREIVAPTGSSRHTLPEYGRQLAQGLQIIVDEIDESIADIAIEADTTA